MLLAILSICSQEELVDSDADSDEAEAEGTPEDLSARRQLIKNKILAVGRMQKVFQLLRFVFFFLFLFFSSFSSSFSSPYRYRCAIHRYLFLPFHFVFSFSSPAPCLLSL